MNATLLSKTRKLTTATIIDGYEIIMRREGAEIDLVIDALITVLGERNESALIEWSMSDDESPRRFFA